MIFKKQQQEESKLSLHIYLNEFAGNIEPKKYIGRDANEVIRLLVNSR